MKGVFKFSVLLVTLTFARGQFETFWDDGPIDRHRPTPSSISRPRPRSSIIFDKSPCYFAYCDDETINVLRTSRFTDQVRCSQLDTQCHCCLRQQLNRGDIENLQKQISDALITHGSGNKSDNKDQVCKILDCNDYQVRAIRSLANPNAECHESGNECECCVNLKLRRTDISGLQRDLERVTNRTSGSPSPRNTNNRSTRFRSPIDQESSFFDWLSPPKNFDSSDDGNPSPGQGRGLLDLDCSAYPCNGPQVKAIKRLPSNVITCVKIGNSAQCDCCFNSSLPILERLQYEFQLSESLGGSNNGDDSNNKRRPINGLTKKDLPYPDSRSRSNSEPNLDCSLHHCQSDFVQLIRSIPNHVISCKQTANGHCRCCIDHHLTNLGFADFWRTFQV